MRTPIRILAAVCIVAAASSPAHAQIFDRLRKKAVDAVQKKAEDKVNNKIDEVTQKMVDNSFNAMFGEDAAAGTKSGGGATGGPSAGPGASAPFSIGSNATTEDRYTFSVVTTMEIESSRKSDQKSILKMHFNPNEAYTGTSITGAGSAKQNGEAFVILDAKNKAMVMLMASDKSKFSIAYDWKDAMNYAQANANAPSEKTNWDTVKVWHSFQKIGTRTIAGYSADGYRTETTDGTVEMWVSHDKSLAGAGMFGANSNLKQMKGRLPAEYPQGMLLEMNSVNKNSGEKVTMRVTDINTNANVTYAMSDYPKMGAAKK